MNLHDYDPRYSPERPRRPRTGRSRVGTPARRRDSEQPRVIRSSDVEYRYDGGRTLGSTTSSRRHGHRKTQDYSAANRGLTYVGDAGMTVLSRRELRQAQQKRKQAITLSILAVVLILLVSSGMLWMNISNANARKALRANTVVAAKSSGSDPVANSTSEATVLAASNASVAERTPIVGTIKSMKIYLPVPVNKLTEVALHQSAFNYSLKINTHLPKVSLESAKKNKGTKRDLSKQETGEGALLVGSHIEMWRSGRPSAMGTALDIGAKQGTPTYSPVDGTVTKIVKYRYDNKVNDYEIHVQCADYPYLEMVMIHVERPQVKVGQYVMGGVTQMAYVRDIAKYVRNQLATYAPHSGNHTHIQFNNTTLDAYKARQKELAKQQQ